MAKKTKPVKSLTRAALLAEMDEKLQSLNLLRSALQSDPSRKQEDLEDYKKRFNNLFAK